MKGSKSPRLAESLEKAAVSVWMILFHICIERIKHTGHLKKAKQEGKKKKKKPASFAKQPVSQPASDLKSAINHRQRR